MDTENLRDGYRPPDIRVLFVGESPPAGGTFFYAANSILYDATKVAFEHAVPELLAHDFLDDFQALGCFVDDLCLTPVNQLRGSPELEQQREKERGRGEASLADRIREADPQAVAIVMKGIAGNVGASLAAAGADGVPTRAFPFPGRPRNTANYIREVAEYLCWLRDEGILRTDQR
jgi:hypothetical protein